MKLEFSRHIFGIIPKYLNPVQLQPRSKRTGRQTWRSWQSLFAVLGKRLIFLIHIKYTRGVQSKPVPKSSYFLCAHSYVSVDRIFFNGCAVHCSSGKYGKLQNKFLSTFAVGITALWVTQHSTCSFPSSTGLESVRNHPLRLHYEGECQRTVKSSTVPSDIRHFPSFQNTWPTAGLLASRWTYSS